jgi:low affinity Fe/Cu permease
MGIQEGMEEMQREPRPRLSRLIDLITEVLGREPAFVAAASVSVIVLIGVAIDGASSARLMNAVMVVVSLGTLLMVFAVQHTSSREARALNLKLDELIRVSEGRNELIGAEDESHLQLAQRREALARHQEGDRRVEPRG